MKNTLYLFILPLCLVFSSQLSAQDFGIRIGLNSTNAKYEIENLGEFETDAQTNLALGVFLNLPIGTEVFSIQPELTYLNRGYTINASAGTLETELTVAYFDLGALAKLNFGSSEGLGFYVGAGPFFSYALSGSRTSAGDEEDIDFDVDRVRRGELQIAGAGGVTFDVGLKFFAEIRYMGSLGNQSDIELVNVKQNAIGLHAGIMVPIGG